MKMIALLLVAALASCGAQQPASQAPTPPPAVTRYGYQIIHAYPHDPQAFTEGLLYRDGVLYESTGLVGRSSVRKVNLETGEVLQHKDVPTYFGEGIVDWNDQLVQLTWQTQIGFVYDLATFETKRQWSYVGEGWSLTRNDKFLVMSDGTADIRFLNPETLQEDHRITVTLNGTAVTQLNELEWIKGEIWANVWQTNFILRINPASGHVVGIIDLTGLLSDADRGGRTVDVLNGIAYDAKTDRVFVTGKLWPKLYEIKLVPRTPTPAS